MQKNKRNLLTLAGTAGLLLLAVLCYPAVDDQIHANHKEEILLNQVLETDSSQTALLKKKEEMNVKNNRKI